MNKQLLAGLVCLSLVCSVSGILDISYAQEEELAQEEGLAQEGNERILVLREAKEYRKNTVAVEAFLIDNVLEAKVTARIPDTKPRIYNALIVGPKLGRLNIESKEVLLASVEEDEPYLTASKDRGFVTFKKDPKLKISKGTLTRELLLFRIPRDKIVKSKKYRLWVQIESMQRGGQYDTYKFELKDLPELLAGTQ